MGYATDGSSHRNGIKGEAKAIKLLKENPSLRARFPEGPIEKAGGTHQTADTLVGGTPLSVKTKAAQGNGTTDWINTTLSKLVKAEGYSLSGYSELEGVVSSMRGKYANTTLSQESPEAELTKRKHRETLLDATNGFFDASFSKANLLEFVSSVCESQLNMDILLLAEKEKKVYHFHGSEHPIFLYLAKAKQDKGEFYLNCKKGARQSRSLFFHDYATGEKIDTTWRIRVVLNNGIGALLAGKKWSTNGSSVLSVKVQQDETDRMLAQIPPSKIFIYRL